MSLKSLLSQDAPLKLGVVKSQRRDGRYNVSINGRQRIVKNITSEVSPGQRVIVSEVKGQWYITDRMSDYQSETADTEIIVNV